VSNSGDNWTVNTNIARLVVETVQGQEVSRRYTVFPSSSIRIDAQCVTPGASWTASDNLFTTNLFFTSGANQFDLQAVVAPDKTMTTYDHVVDSTGAYRTNITATGQPNSTYAYVIDGVSNRTVLNVAGYPLTDIKYDIATGIIIFQDVYANFDNY